MKKSIGIIFFLFQMNQSSQAQTKIENKMNTQYTTDSVKSADGTTIGYRKLGQGPGLIILHGTFESAQSHDELVQALADSFTVYSPDRRCRGMSPYYTTQYDIQKDVEDLDAIMQKTGTHYIFAVSSGAIITLRAALTLPSLQKIALYEPPLALDSTKASTIFKRYDKEITMGQTSAALVTAMKGGEMGPKIFNIMPRFILRGMTNKMMKGEEKKMKDAKNYVTMRQLAPSIHHDLQIVVENIERMEDFKNIRKSTLLLGGTKSAEYLKKSVLDLEKIIPGSKKLVFEGLGHGGSGSSEWGGNPKLIAKELHKFFTEK